MNIAVIFAGGVGSRMHSKERPKQFLEMYNKPIIIHTLEHFQNHSMIDAIIVVCIESWIPYLNNLLYKFRIEKVKKSCSRRGNRTIIHIQRIESSKRDCGCWKSNCINT